MLFLRIVASVTSTWVGGPFGNSRSPVLPVPATADGTQPEFVRQPVLYRPAQAGR